ncbi:MAG: Chaperone SurA [Flavobacterium sp. SCGC AAA160-P02]|nr:MAG: Chaperone SurA [Flavobacterium sp. SCGC AAA160-P02]
MAILSKIRDRSIALIAVIGLALFAFVLDPSTLTDFFDSTKINEVGEVDGESISRLEYAEALDSYKTKTNGRVSDMQAAKTVWENILKEKIYTKQLQLAGVTIGENDVLNTIINSSFVQTNPQFLNEAGLFDKDSFMQFLKDTKESEDQNLWIAWNNYINEIATNLKRDTYNNLVKVGLGASLKEGEYSYREDNDLVSAEFVYIPYSSIPDSLVSVTKKDVESYIKKNSNEFEVEASRDISYVKFDILPTDEDKEEIKNKVGSYLEDRDDINKVTAQKIVIQGLKNSEDYNLFFEENISDIPMQEMYLMKGELPESISESVLSGNVDDTFGPYEDKNYFKISKITKVFFRPDSVKASSIFIPYVGSQGALPTTTKTEMQAKASIDSIYKLVRRNKKKFAQIANEINTDGSKQNGGNIGWSSHNLSFNSPRFDPELASFMFDNKTGKVGVVKSKYGYHVIRIDEQKNRQKGVRIVTFGREIIPSQETENTAFQNAEKFALDISSEENNFYDVAKEKSYQARPVVGLKIMDDKIPGFMGPQRQIITWAFGSETNVGDFQRFDIDKGYVVALLTNKTNKGLINPSKAINRVRPILLNEKKAFIIESKMKGSSLNEIAKANKVSIKEMNNIALKSPSITGVGFEPKVVGAMYYAEENKLYNKVKGDKGVFAFVVTNKESAPTLPNYEMNRQRISQDRKNKVVNIFEALKEVSDIEDNRAGFHGVQ